MTDRQPQLTPRSVARSSRAQGRAVASLVACVLTVGLFWPASTWATPPLKLVVAVGDNAGLAQEVPLKHAGDDAQRVARVLQSLGGVSRPNTQVLIGATPQAILAAIARAASRARAAPKGPVTFTFYFSGHGDATSLHASGGALPLKDLEAAIARVPATLRLSIVDACRSAAGRSKGLTEGQPFALSVTRTPSGPQGTLAIRSSSDGEDAQESDQLGGGVFTHYLLSGLRGAADSNRDRQVTFDEAYAYAHNFTLRRSAASRAAPQHASREVVLKGAGAVVLTRTAKARSKLTLPKGADLQYMVYRLPASTVVAEAWARPGHPVTLALPAGRFLVQRRGTDRHGAVEVALPYGGSTALTHADFDAIPLAQLVAKGGGVLRDWHEFFVGYGVLGHVDRGVGHRLRLGYGYLLEGVGLTVAFELGMGDYSTTVHDVSARWVGGEIRGAGRFHLAPVELRFTLGAALRWIDETLSRLDAHRLVAAGYPTGSSSAGLGAGPVAAFEVHIPLAASWWIQVGFGWTSLFVPSVTGLSHRWEAGLDLGVRATF